MNSKLLIAILLVAGSIPFASVPTVSANHFSTGVSDGVGIQAQESADDPSVCDRERPGCPDGAHDLWDIGQQRSGCTEFTGSPDNVADEAGAVPTAHPFCGRLVYNQDTSGDFVRDSPPDQDYPGDNPFELQLDGMVTTNVGTFIGYCPPFWCAGATSEAFQTAASAAGISDDYEGFQAGAGGTGENQIYGANVQLPNAAQAASEASGMYEANGWIAPVGDRSIVAFLTSPIRDVDGDGLNDFDADGNINQTELEALVAFAKTGDSPIELDPDAAPILCASNPEVSISISAPQVAFCEIQFTYLEEEGGTTNGLYWDSYSSKCGSPTYVCGAQTEGWYANLVLLPLPTARGIALNEQNAAGDSTIDYEIWDFTVAPTAPECNGMEPGFMTESATSTPYLAHDLDIYEQAGDAVGVNQAENVDTLAVNAFFGAEDAANDAADEIVETIEDQADLPPAVTDTTYVASKDARVEPNTVDPSTGELLDSSQSTAGVQADTVDEVLQRSVDAPGNCAPFQEDSGETSETVDPWVDYIDNQAWQDLAAVGTSIHADQEAHQHRDSSNIDTLAPYYTSGMVGMFTDKDDDGVYEQAGSDTMWQDWQAVGSYPMFWDMWISEDEQTGEYAADGGCKPGFGNVGIADQMAGAGYGIHTGLIQVVYLSEPTVLKNDDANIQLTYLEGDNAFVTMNQALHTLLEAGDLVASQVVQRALEKVPGKSFDFQGYANTTDVQFPGKGQIESDFFEQCGNAAGGYTSSWTYTHNCELGCAGDTIVTSYVFELPDGNAGSEQFDAFTGDGDTPYDFHTEAAGYDDALGVNQWFDVDPFDGDESRNAQASSAPPAAE